eukprot:Gb_16614 [translate_table: standard]
MDSKKPSTSASSSQATAPGVLSGVHLQFTDTNQEEGRRKKKKTEERSCKRKPVGASRPVNAIIRSSSRFGRVGQTLSLHLRSKAITPFGAPRCANAICHHRW